MIRKFIAYEFNLDMICRFWIWAVLIAVLVGSALESAFQGLT